MSVFSNQYKTQFLMFLFDRFLVVYEMYVHVTKHGDQCPSPMGVNWVGDTVGIDFMGVSICQRCSLLR